MNKIIGQLNTRTRLMGENVQNKTKSYIYNAKAGWIEGSAVAKSKNMSDILAFFLKTKNAVTASKIKKDDMPYLIAGATILTPLPTIAIFAIIKLGLKCIKFFR